jgi:hypothetical protein
LAALTAAGTFIDAIWAIVKPVATGVLGNVDLERRNAAVKAYFSDEKNVSTLKAKLQAIEAF